MLILVGVACLAWITLFSVVFVNLTGIAPSNSWLVAIALIFASTAWVLVMIREFRDAVELPDSFAANDPYDHKRFQLEMAEASPISSGERWIPVRAALRRRPRKSRSTRDETIPQ